MLAEMELRPTEPAGECIADGGSDGRNDAGDEGGATKGILTIGACVAFAGGAAVAPVVDGVGSGTRTACPIRFLFF